MGPVDIPALTFAGLRYALVTLGPLPFALQGGRLATLRRLPGRGWRDLLLLGVVPYALAQGAQFLALAHLPAATLSLVQSFSPLVVALLATRTLREALAPRRWAGIALVVVGALAYFGPALPPLDQRLGLLVALVGLGANAVGGVLGRAVNRSRALDPLLGVGVPGGGAHREGGRRGRPRGGGHADGPVARTRRRSAAAARRPRMRAARPRPHPHAFAPATVDWSTVANRLSVERNRRA